MFRTVDNENFDAVSSPPGTLRQLFWQGLPGKYLAITSSGLYTSPDYGATWGPLRPNTEFGTTWPAGASGYQVAFAIGPNPGANCAPASEFPCESPLRMAISFAAADPSFASFASAGEASSPGAEQLNGESPVLWAVFKDTDEIWTDTLADVNIVTQGATGAATGTLVISGPVTAGSMVVIGVVGRRDDGTQNAIMSNDGGLDLIKQGGVVHGNKTLEIYTALCPTSTTVEFRVDYPDLQDAIDMIVLEVLDVFGDDAAGGVGSGTSSGPNLSVEGDALFISNVDWVITDATSALGLTLEIYKCVDEVTLYAFGSGGLYKLVSNSWVLHGDALPNLVPGYQIVNNGTYFFAISDQKLYRMPFAGGSWTDLTPDLYACAISPTCLNTFDPSFVGPETDFYIAGVACDAAGRLWVNAVGRDTAPHTGGQLDFWVGFLAISEDGGSTWVHTPGGGASGISGLLTSEIEETIAGPLAFTHFRGPGPDAVAAFTSPILQKTGVNEQFVQGGTANDESDSDNNLILDSGSGSTGEPHDPFPDMQVGFTPTKMIVVWSTGAREATLPLSSYPGSWSSHATGAVTGLRAVVSPYGLVAGDSWFLDGASITSPNPGANLIGAAPIGSKLYMLFDDGSLWSVTDPDTIGNWATPTEEAAVLADAEDSYLAMTAG